MITSILLALLCSSSLIVFERNNMIKVIIFFTMFFISISQVSAIQCSEFNSIGKVTKLKEIRNSNVTKNQFVELKRVVNAHINNNSNWSLRKDRALEHVKEIGMLSSYIEGPLSMARHSCLLEPDKNFDEILIEHFDYMLDSLASSLKSVSKAFSIEKHLMNEVNEANKSLPVMIDKDTRMDSTLSKGKNLYYVYTMINLNSSDVSISRLNSFLVMKKKQIIKFSCSEKNTLFLLNYGAVVHYLYNWKNGEHMRTIRISKNDC